MAEIRLEIPDATERALTHLSLRSLSASSVPHVEDDIGMIPYNIWSISPYFTIGGLITADEGFPVSLAVKVEGNLDGNRPILRNIPWEPLGYEYRLAPPASRWVAGSRDVLVTTNMMVAHWYDSVVSEIVRVLNPMGIAKSLISLGSQTPAYSYRGVKGWTDCDAVSIQPSSRMEASIGESDYSGFSLAAVGTFDKAGASPYRILTLETVGTAVSMIADGVGRLVLMDGETEIAAMPGRYEPGVPVALLLNIGTAGATICLIDINGNRSAVSGQVNPEILPTIRNIVIGAPLRTDNEFMEVAFWNKGEPPLLIAAQLMAVLAYYRQRRPE